MRLASSSMQPRTSLVRLSAVLAVSAAIAQGCGYGLVWYRSDAFPYSGNFENSRGLHLAYRIRHPYPSFERTAKLPLLIYIDGSGYPLDATKDQILAHFQERGFVAAMKQKEGVAPSEGDFSGLDFESRVQANLDFLRYVLQQRLEIDPTRAYLLGHGEGATIAGTVASRYEGTAGLIWVSSSLDEDFYDEIVSQHPVEEKPLIDQIRQGRYAEARWQGYATAWWRQHFHHESLPELMRLSCPILFMIGTEDQAYPLLTRRFQEMQEKGKKAISLVFLRGAGHGTIAPEAQGALLSTIDQWFERLLASPPCPPRIRRRRQTFRLRRNVFLTDSPGAAPPNHAHGRGTKPSDAFSQPASCRRADGPPTFVCQPCGEPPRVDPPLPPGIGWRASRRRTDPSCNGLHRVKRPLQRRSRGQTVEVSL